MAETTAITATNSTIATADLERLAAEAIAYTEAAKAPRTVHAYQADFRLFTEWCDERNLTALPADVATIALYVTDQAATRKVSTIRRRLASIAEAHKQAAPESPIPTRDPRIGTLLKGITNTQAAAAAEAGARSVTRQAEALDASKVVQVVTQIKGDELAAKRDRALIALGFAGFFRRAELVALTVNSIEWTGTEALIHLTTSKTDQAGQGATVRIENGSAVNPPALLREWIEAAEITEGPIFRGITKGGTVKDEALTGRSVARIIKARAEQAGINPEHVSGHSLRRGAATTARRQGADPLAIARRGRWADNSQTLARYIETSAAESIDLGL